MILTANVDPGGPSRFHTFVNLQHCQFVMTASQGSLPSHLKNITLAKENTSTLLQEMLGT